MKASATAIDHPRIVIIGAVLAVILAGAVAWIIPVQLTPAIHTAVVLVAVPYPGAEPTEVEEQVTRKIEDALQRLEGVDFIASSSMRGSSVIQVIFLDGEDADKAVNDVDKLVNEVKRELPLAREVQPIISKVDFDGMPIMLVNIGAPDDFDERTLKWIAEDVQDEIEVLPGVANSQLFGGREREIQLNVNPDLLVQYGLSFERLRAALAGAHAPMPGGSLNSDEFDLQVRNESKFESAEDVKRVALGERDGWMIHVGDVAEVYDTYSRVKNVAQLDGKRTATIIVYKEPDINTLGTARAIKARVEELAAAYPHLSLTCTRDMSAEIALMFTVLGSNALSGAALVFMIMCWTMGFRSSILVVSAVPFATGLALIFLYLTGTAISNMVIFSFILVLGMVVDGAIIVTENIHRHVELGLPPKKAAKIGVQEVSLPVLAADLTAIAAFLPMLLVPGIMGDFMGVMPVVVSVSLAGSLLTDHFLVPVLAAYWFKQRPVPANGPAIHAADAGGGIRPAALTTQAGPISKYYVRLLEASLRHPFATLGGAALAVAWAMAMLQLGYIKYVFFPESDRGQFEIAYELPLGYSIEETRKAADVFLDPLEELRQRGEVVHYVSALGSSQGLSTRLEGDPAMGPEFGRIMVQLRPATQRERGQQEIIAELRKMIRPWPDMVYRFEIVKDGPPGGADVAMRLTGKNLEELGKLGARLSERMKSVPGTIDSRSDYRPDNPELVIEPRPDVVGLFGMTEAEVARAVQTAVLGDNSIEISLDDEDVAIRLQADPKLQRYKSDVKRMLIRGGSGKVVTVDEVADVRLERGLYSVNRHDRRRAVKVSCNVKWDEGFVPDDVFRILRAEILPELGFRPVPGSGVQAIRTPDWLEGFLPESTRTSLEESVPENTMAFLGQPNTPSEGMRCDFTGENEERDEGFMYLLNSMIVGVVLITAILVLQFNSFRQALVVMATVPLSFVGVVFGMWAWGFPFSLAAFIGLVALTGIVVNDAIVLVDFVNQARKRGLSVHDSLIESGIQRSRPVMLTLLTTIGDMIPLFLNLGGGAEFWQPLTGSIIFGISFATLLTLLVIPVSYSLVYRRTYKRELALLGAAA
jgi:multidrug efflux pump subunit AcrB